MVGISNVVRVAAVTPNCPLWHTISDIDPSGPLQTPDGTWHVFPISGGWSHCTASDLIHWNCSHPTTGWPMINTGAITVTPQGYFAMQANNKNVAMAKASAADMNAWVHKGVIGR